MFKSFFQRTLPAFIGVFAGLLAYHYRLTLVHTTWHGLAYGIPWHTKYFWPIGPNAWIVPTTLGIAAAVAGVTWLSARQIISIRWDDLCDFISVVGFIVFAMACMGSFIGGYVLYGCVCLAGCAAILISLYADEWGFGNETV